MWPCELAPRPGRVWNFGDVPAAGNQRDLPASSRVCDRLRAWARSSVESPTLAGDWGGAFSDRCLETATSLLSPESDTMRACDRSCSIEGKTAWWSPSAPVFPAVCPRAKPRNRRLRTLGKLSRPTSAPSKPTTCQFLKSTSMHVSLPCELPPRRFRARMPAGT